MRESGRQGERRKRARNNETKHKGVGTGEWNVKTRKMAAKGRKKKNESEKYRM